MDEVKFLIQAVSYDQTSTLSSRCTRTASRLEIRSRIPGDSIREPTRQTTTRSGGYNPSRSSFRQAPTVSGSGCAPTTRAAASVDSPVTPAPTP